MEWNVFVTCNFDINILFLSFSFHTVTLTTLNPDSQLLLTHRRPCVSSRTPPISQLSSTTKTICRRRASSRQLQTIQRPREIERCSNKQAQQRTKAQLHQAHVKQVVLFQLLLSKINNKNS